MAFVMSALTTAMPTVGVRGNVRVAPKAPAQAVSLVGSMNGSVSLGREGECPEALIPRPERRGGGEHARLRAPDERVARFDAACGIGRVVVWRVQAVALARRPPSPRLSGAFFQGFRVLGSPRFFLKWLRLGPTGRASERGAGVNPLVAPRARAVDRPMGFEPWNPDFPPNHTRPRSTRRFDASATSPRPPPLSIFFLSGPSP